MKKNELSPTYLKKDLLLFLVLQAVMLGALIAMYFYDQSTGYFSNLAEQLYSALIK